MSDPARTSGNGQLFLEAVLWIVPTGSLWRDFSASFGNWNGVLKRRRDWLNVSIFQQLFDVVSEGPTWE
ncbi:MAG: transposase [Acetobacteraceae bacterium]|nr:transposase [Acetobacteraceae bacterium]